MKNKRSIANMTTSIINSVLVLAFTPILIVFAALKSNILEVVFISISYPLLFIHFILKSIYYPQTSHVPRNILSLISDIMLNIFICLITIYNILNIDSNIKWFLLGVICFLTIISIVIEFANNLLIHKIIVSITVMIALYTILIIYPFNIVTYMGVISIVLYYIITITSDTKNNYLNTIEIIPLLLFSLFLLFI